MLPVVRDHDLFDLSQCPHAAGRRGRIFTALSDLSSAETVRGVCEAGRADLESMYRLPHAAAAIPGAFFEYQRKKNNTQGAQSSDRDLRGWSGALKPCSPKSPPRFRFAPSYIGYKSRSMGSQSGLEDTGALSLR